MEVNPGWKETYDKELRRAVQARQEGNEGMSRVCARRAAGVIIGEYLQRRGFTGLTKSTYDRIRAILALPDVDESIKQVSYHFIMKVNQEHGLASGTDLIQEAAWLKYILLEGQIC